MNLNDLPASIADLPLFHGLSFVEILDALSRCYRQSIPAGQTLTQIGEAANCCYLILTGRIEVRIRVDRERVPVNMLGPGELFGEMGMFTKIPVRLADAVVIRDATLVQIPYTHFDRLEDSHPEIAQKLKQNLHELAIARGREDSAIRDGQTPPPILAPGSLEGPKDIASIFGESSDSPRTHVQPSLEPGETAPINAAPLVPIQVKMALARCPIFEGFENDDILKLIDRAEPRRYKVGDAVVRQGDAAQSLFVVALGRLGVNAAVNGENQVLAQLGPGQCFGEIPLAYGLKTRVASVLADTNATVLEITYKNVEEAVQWRPQTDQKFKENVARVAQERQPEATNVVNSEHEDDAAVVSD